MNRKIQIFEEHIKNSNIGKVKEFLDDKTFDPTYHRHIAFEKSVYFGHYSIFKLFLNDRRFKNNSRYESSFVSACQSGFLDIVEEFFNFKHFDISCDNNLAFISACYSKNTSVINLFLNDERFNFIDLKIEDFNKIKNKNHSFIYLIFQCKKIRNDISCWITEDFNKEIYHNLKKIELSESIMDF